jgi:hypothetical protein
MPAALPRYALVSFNHFDRVIKAGDELELHDPLVEARPDLFTTDPPKKSKKTSGDTPAS